MELTENNVEEILNNCLFQNGEDTTKHVRAEGILQTFGLHPGRLEENKANIGELINQLPESFLESNGGDTFLNMCKNKNGDQWASYHRIMEILLILGIAIGKLKYKTPRKLWFGTPPDIIIVEEETHKED